MMKLKHFALLVLIGAIVGLISLPRAGVNAQEIVSENLFTNPGFEGGYYNQGSIAQIAVPNGWTMHWLDNVAFEGTEGRPAYRPETVVWLITDAPERERPLFWRDGSYTLKIFKGWAPLYAALSQDVSGLEVGRQYRMVVPIFVDMVEEYKGGGKVQPSRNDSGFIRFGVSGVGATWRDGSQINYSPTWTADNVYPFYLAMQTYVWDFTATAESMTVWIEMGSNYPYRNNGFFLDGLGLYALSTTGLANPAASGSSGSGAPAVAGPTLTPLPTATPRADGAVIHIVQSGDSMWTIAIQYASTLGIPPEEALPLIQERNNKPAFVSVGQELVIVPPGEAAPVVAEEPVAEEAASEEEATAVPEQEPTAAPESAEPTEVAAAPAETGGSTDAPAPVASASNSICVAVFNDVNSDGAQDVSSESLQSDAAITLFRAGSTVSTYITDGISEPFCFQNLDPDTYQVQVYSPAGFAPTTADNWAVSVTEGTALSVAFGVTAVTETAAVTDTSADTAVSTDTGTTDAASAPAEDTAPAEGGFFSSIGGIILVIAGILVLLAGAGVVMLRRG